MTRSQLLKAIQDKLDQEIGNRTTGELSFRIKMYEGGIRQSETQVIQPLTVEIGQAQ